MYFQKFRLGNLKVCMSFPYIFNNIRCYLLVSWRKLFFLCLLVFAFYKYIIVKDTDLLDRKKRIILSSTIVLMPSLTFAWNSNILENWMEKNPMEYNTSIIVYNKRSWMSDLEFWNMRSTLRDKMTRMKGQML